MSTGAKILNKNESKVAVLRWWRNRMGRPLSPLLIHQKLIWMLNNFHKTTSESWWRTPGTQKGSPFFLKGYRSKYKRQKRDKRVRDGDLSWGESWKTRSLQRAGNPLTRGSVGSFRILEGNISGRGKKQKKKNPQNMHLTATPSGEVAQMLDPPPASRGWTGRRGRYHQSLR